jgi:hypothetical protein
MIFIYGQFLFLFKKEIVKISRNNLLEKIYSIFGIWGAEGGGLNFQAD